MDWFPEVLGNVMVAGDKETAAFEAVPVPVSVAVCGEFVALSAIDSVALSAPTIDGVNTTETVHEVDGGTEAPQLFVWLKSLAFVPEAEYGRNNATRSAVTQSHCERAGRSAVLCRWERQSSRGQCTRSGSLGTRSAEGSGYR